MSEDDIDWIYELRKYIYAWWSNDRSPIMKPSGEVVVLRKVSDREIKTREDIREEYREFIEEYNIEMKDLTEGDNDE